MTETNDPVLAARNALHELDDWAVEAGVLPSTYEGPDSTPTVGERRRRRSAGLPDPLGTASLVMNEDGVLLWRLADGARTAATRRARRQRRAVPAFVDGEVVELYHYDKLDPNRVNALLVDADESFNKNQGLWRLALDHRGQAKQSVRRAEQVVPSGKLKRLLFVHGTFSKSEAFFDGMHSKPEGRDAVATLFDRYDEVLAFDHPTLSASPVMNAFDLARLLSRADGPLDVIAHSRGGLVARWTLDGFGLNGAGPRRAVVVGSPLNGTSLASPPQLRSALSALTNYGNALRTAGAVAAVYAPFLAVPLLLLRVASTVLTVTAKTPITDAAIAMIPGLHGQSRIGDHPELKRLRAVKLAKPTQYFVVKSNFETERPGWKFWKWFRTGTLFDSGADLIFPGANDLVVDTDSMSDLPGVTLQASAIKDFGTQDVVHHTNYFEQKATLDFILDKLK